MKVAVQPSLLPPQAIVLPPRVAGATIVVDAHVDGELAEVILRYGLAVVLRVSTAGGTSVAKAAAEAGDTLARRLSARGISINDALPRVKQLAAAHATGLLSRHPRPGRTSFKLRATLVEVEGVGLTILLITGSAAQLNNDLDQPTSLAVGEFLSRVEPGLLATTELTRIIRDPMSLGAIAKPFVRFQQRHDRPAWLCADDDSSYDPEALFLEAWGPLTEGRVYRAAARGRDEATRFATRRTGAHVSSVPVDLVMVNGRVRDPGGGPVLPGYSQTVLADEKGSRVGPIIYAEMNGSRPEPHETLGALPFRRNTRGDLVPYPDQIAILRWLFRTLDTPGWTDVAKVGRQLELMGFCTQKYRGKHGLGETFVATREASRKVIRHVMDHLEDYLLRQMYRRRDGQEWRITGLPWVISAFDAQRLGRRWALPGTRERKDTYLWTGQVITVSDRHGARQGVLEGRRRRSDGEVIYRVLTPDKSCALGSYDDPIAPIPQTTLKELHADALASQGATLTAPSQAEPSEADLLAAEVATLDSEVAMLVSTQRRRFNRLDPGRDEAHPGEDDLDDDALLPTEVRIDPDAPPFEQALKKVYDDDAVVLKKKEATLEDKQHRLAVLRESPQTVGIPVWDLWPMVRALTDDSDTSMRIPMQNATTELRLVRPDPSDTAGEGRAPYRVSLTLTITDPEVGARQARAYGSYLDRYQRNSHHRTRALLEQMTAGIPLLTLTNGQRDLVPVVRAALTSTSRPLRCLAISDPTILTMTMKVCHPLRDYAASSPREEERALVGSPLDDAAIEELAEIESWPLPLLFRIRDLHMTSTRTTATWLYRPAEATQELYATARRRGQILIRQRDVKLLRSARTALDWEIRGSTATLIPCGSCGSRRIYNLQLMEAVGGICRRCRSDRAGVHWHRRYDSLSA